MIESGLGKHKHKVQKQILMKQKILKLVIYSHHHSILTKHNGKDRTRHIHI